MKVDALTQDLLKSKPDHPSTKTYDFQECHSCGTKFNRDDPHCPSVLFDGFVIWFCSDRCKDWFHEGNPSFREQRRLASKDNSDLYRDHAGEAMRMTKAGFLISCANCGKDFESRGLRCCSKDCEKELRLKFDDLGLKDTPSRLYANLEMLRQKTKPKATSAHVDPDVDLMKKIKRKELVH